MIRCLSLLVVLLGGVRAFAQAPVQPLIGPVPPTRLQQLEMTYQDNLKRVHAPLLQQYLTELNALLAKSLAADASAIKAEIDRVQKMIASGGLIALDKKAAVVADNSRNANGIVFTLEPHEAQPPPPNDSVTPLGTAAWTLSKLPAGNYEVIAHYACPKLPATPTLQISFHGQNFTRELKPNNVTKDGDTFRVLRLCQLRLKEDATYEALTVSSPANKEPWLMVKQILIVKAKDAN